MAEYNLNVYDPKTGEVVKTHHCPFISVSLHIKFQETAERFVKETATDTIGPEAETMEILKNLFLKAFPELTENEYMNQVKASEVLAMFNKIFQTSLEQSDGESKN